MAPVALLTWAVVILCAVTLIWPLNVPLMALAYKVRQGAASVAMEPREFWMRSALASFALCVLSLVLVGLSRALTGRDGFSPGLVRIVLLTAYVPGAVWLLFWLFAFEEVLDALALFVIYVLLPGVPLYLIGWLTGLWAVLADKLPWLFAVP